MSKKIKAIDLFCGGGGTSTGLRAACASLGKNVQLIAVNHWEIAIATHSKNHEDAEHFCTGIDSLDPRKLVPGGKLDLLVASPECTHHSNASGGKPLNDQSRASGWCVVKWASQIRIQDLLIENVPEFRTWGPLGANGRPLKRRKGETYQAFLAALRSLGYKVEDRILNAADYGDATSRKRLFIRARLGRKPIVWPEPTHEQPAKSSKTPAMFNMSTGRKPHRQAREIIDWTIPSQSIFTRKRPLKPNTLNRIFKGLEKFAGLPFIVPQMSGGINRTLDRPVPTITTTSRGIGLCEPFIVELRNNMDARRVDDPLSVITAGGIHHGLCEPFLIQMDHSKSVLPGRSVDRPMPTITGADAMGLAQPFIIPVNHGEDSRTYGLDRPMPTVTTIDAWALIEPFLVKYNGTGGPMTVDEPVDTITAKDRFGLVQAEVAPGQLAWLDIRFRMLQPHELAAAMSFPKDYVFAGNREEKVKQIGNAVAVGVATALCRSILQDAV